MTLAPKAKLRFLIYAAAIAGIFMFHSSLVRKFIYFPDAVPEPSSLTALNNLGFETFGGDVGKDGFSGYLALSKSPQRLVVIFHGNAGSAADRIYIAAPLLDRNYAVFLAEYPGYGGRAGSPSEKSFFEAALSDLKALTEKYPNLPLVVIGESIGSGVASHVVSKVPMSALILITPFTSLADVASVHYPFLPVYWLLPDRFDNVASLRNVKIPLLVVHGNRDGVVPFSLGRKLFDSYSGPKEFVELDGSDHNDLPWRDESGTLWSRIIDFVSRRDIGAANGKRSSGKYPPG